MTLPVGQTIGPFELIESLGRGAMGRVFRARYPAQDVEVAVKVMHAERAFSRETVGAFEQEVQAMASLDHPGIAHIYDYGVTTEHDALSWDGLGPGVPWLAMELGVGEDLDTARPRGDWTTLRRILLEILDALAHAHARQIVHRDLKPANVLISSSAGGLKLLLADFGIAHIWNPRTNTGSGDVAAVSAGTPHYMAPEQLHGAWRDYGGWTDLYALGCIAFEFICGSPPFDGDSVLQLAMHHLSSPIPKLDPLFEVPPGLDAWIGRLLAKDRFGRFSSAAEAAWSLNELEGVRQWPAPLGEVDFPTLTNGGKPAERNAEGRSGTLDLSATDILSSSELSAVLHDDRQKLAGGTGPGGHSAPGAPEPSPGQLPFPVNWLPTRQQEERQLSGAGEALVGLREVAFVDRDEAREAFWSAMRDARALRVPQVYCVESPPGLGKSRLVEWMTRRAHELGVAETLRVSGSAVGSADEPLVQIVEQMFRLEGMSRLRAHERIDEMLRRIESSLPEGVEPRWDREYHSAALTNLIRPQGPDEPSDGIAAVRFERLAQKYDLITRFLYAFTRRHSAVVWCDEAHHAQSFIGLIEWIRDNELDELPVLFALTYREDALVARPLERDMFDRLVGDASVAHLRLGRLGRDDHRKLVHNTLGLVPVLAAEVAERTDGNPFFATQLLEAWVQQDVLLPTADGSGYVIDGGARFPETVDELADMRIELFVEQFDDPGAARMVLEIAVALARPIGDTTLDRAGARLNVDVPPGFVDRLVVSGIGRRLSAGWSFDEGLFRDRVAAEARRRGTWQRVNLALAEELEARGKSGQDERLASHYLEAGSARLALEPLGRALDQKLLESVYLEALSIADTIEQLCDFLGQSASDPARLHAILRRSETLRFAGRFEESEAELGRVLGVVQELEPRWAADAYRVHAGLMMMLARMPESLASYQRAGELFGSAGDDRGLSQVRHGEGFLLTMIGDWERAGRCLSEAREAAARAGAASRELGWGYQAQAELELRRRPDLGRTFATKALEIFTSMGSMSGVALSHRTLADCARFDGDLEVARENYAATVEVSNQIRSIHGVYGRAGLAMVAIDKEDYATAEGLIEGVFGEFDSVATLFRPIPYFARLCICAGLDQPAKFDEAYAAVEPTLKSGALAHPDLIALPERAGDLLWAAGDGERASKCYGLAARFAQNSPGEAAGRIHRKWSNVRQSSGLI